MLPYRKDLKPLARQSRNNPTEAEKQFWRKVRGKQVNGLAFYRQKPIGGFIVDFYCPKLKLVVELDGGGHGMPEQIAYDRKRSETLKKMGLRELRFSNQDILKNIEGVLRMIEELDK